MQGAGFADIRKHLLRISFAHDNRLTSKDRSLEMHIAPTDAPRSSSEAQALKSTFQLWRSANFPQQKRLAGHHAGLCARRFLEARLEEADARRSSFEKQARQIAQSTKELRRSTSSDVQRYSTRTSSPSSGWHGRMEYCRVMWAKCGSTHGTLQSGSEAQSACTCLAEDILCLCRHTAMQQELEKLRAKLRTADFVRASSGSGLEQR